MRANRVIGFAVVNFTSDLKDIAGSSKDVSKLEELTMNGTIVPADLAQTFLLLISLSDNSLLSYPLGVIDVPRDVTTPTRIILFWRY